MLTIKIRAAALGFGINDRDRDNVLRAAEQAVDDFSADPNHSVPQLAVSMALIHDSALRQLFKVCADSVLKHKYNAPDGARAILITQMGMYSDEILAMEAADDARKLGNPEPTQPPPLPEEKRNCLGLLLPELPECDPKYAKEPLYKKFSNMSNRHWELQSTLGNALNDLEFEKFWKILSEMEDIRDEQIHALLEEIVSLKEQINS